MERKEVNSSNLKSVGYNEKDKILEIEFHDGGVYQYEDVPRYIFDNLVGSGFLNIDSVGRYFINNIKGRYSFTKIRG